MNSKIISKKMILLLCLLIRLNIMEEIDYPFSIYSDSGILKLSGMNLGNEELKSLFTNINLKRLNLSDLHHNCRFVI